MVHGLLGKRYDDLYTIGSKYGPIILDSVSLNSALLDNIQDNKNFFYKVITMYNCTSGNTGDTTIYTGFGLAIRNLYISSYIFIIYGTTTDNTGNNAKILRVSVT